MEDDRKQEDKKIVEGEESMEKMISMEKGISMEEGMEKEKTADSEKGKRVLKEILSWVMVVVTAFVLAFVITHFVIIKAEVPTGSMKDTIQEGDRLIGWRLAYLFSDPKRGDIVIFPFPDNEEEKYIKRIIGLPGETIEIIDGVLYIDGTVYEEDYIKEPMRGNYGPYVVPEGCYFMMGDNRNHSSDSRAWQNHYVKKSKIIGKAWLRYEPSIGLLK